VSAELKNGSLHFADCEEFAFDSIDISVMSTKSPYETQTVWHSTNPNGASRLLQVTYGIDPPGFSPSIGPDSFEIRKSRIEVIFGNSSPDAGPGPHATFDGARLVEGRWLNWDGNVVSTPCDG
jgi:hypothetical protein